MEALQLDRDISERLARTWNAFFAKFGRLTAVQRDAIPPILEGSDVLLCAPTASGKTEAVCAPLLERCLPHERWTLLYVSPTRALVNDLYERLIVPCGILGAEVVRRTGDHPSRPACPPQVLITTPESFDSLMCRGRSDEYGHFLAFVRAVVLDEIHLLHGGPRGEQVRWLLRRLRRLREYAVTQRWISDSRLQVCALSATVDDPCRVADAYLGGGQVVQTAGSRDIEQVTVECDSPAAEDALPALAASVDAPDKILVFSNTRKRVDALSHLLQRPLGDAGYKVRAHHGSLDKRLREEAEAIAKSGHRVVLFATSTLEIGIDIGDIDLVVLDGPAPDVGALLQRIGRGNRRTGKTRVMTCSGSLAEVLIHSAMLSDAAAGHLPTRERGPQYAVARQQLSSYIFQSPEGTRTPVSLANLCNECLPDRKPDELISHLISAAEWQNSPSGVRLGQELVDGAYCGEIHSNIETALGLSVVDETSGAAIASGVRFTSGRGMMIGGQLLKVKGCTDFAVSVKVTGDRQLADGKWSYVSGAWFEGAGQPGSVRRFLGIADTVWPVINANGTTIVFHFGGGRRQAVLDLVRRAFQIPGFRRVDPWALYFVGTNTGKPSVLDTVNPGVVENGISERISALERTLARPKANAHLPHKWRLDEIRDWLAVSDECRALRESRWQQVEESDLAAHLQTLATGLNRVESQR